MFESQKYLNLEIQIQHPDGDALVEQALRLLGESVQDLLLECASALRDIILWLERINANRFQTCLGRKKKDLRFDAVRDIADAKLRLWDSLSEFRESKRCVLKLDLLEFSKFIDAIASASFYFFPIWKGISCWDRTCPLILFTSMTKLRPIVTSSNALYTNII